MEVEKVITDLESLSQERYTEHDYISWDLDFLTNYIVNEHHKYTREALPLLIQYGDKVAKVHGGENPETIEIAHIIHELEDEMFPHMQKEENVLFPYIKHLADAKRHGESKPFAPFGTVGNPIRMMEEEHEVVGNALKKIATLSHNFTLPEGACNTFTALYTKLEEFQNMTFEHVHLENNILFPKALTLESQL